MQILLLIAIFVPAVRAENLLELLLNGKFRTVVMVMMMIARTTSKT